MYNLTEQSVERLLAACRKLHGGLIASPVWELLKDEPVIIEFTTAMADVEQQVNQSGKETAV